MRGTQVLQITCRKHVHIHGAVWISGEKRSPVRTATHPPHYADDQVRVYPYILFRATHVSTKKGLVQHHVQMLLVRNKCRSMVLHRSQVTNMHEGLRFYRSLDGKRVCGIYILQITSWETCARDLTVADHVLKRIRVHSAAYITSWNPVQVNSAAQITSWKHA